MPIFHDDLAGSPPSGPWRRRNVTDDKEDSAPRFARAWTNLEKMDAAGSRPPLKIKGPADEEQRPLSRGERYDLIERIKRTGSPTWAFMYTGGRKSPKEDHRTGSPTQSSSPGLLPAAEFSDTAREGEVDKRDGVAAGLEIVRPRSALHSGDFREDGAAGDARPDLTQSLLATSPVAPWHSEFPAFAAHRSVFGQQQQPHCAISPSLRNVVLMPPTSPLVHAISNPDVDWSPQNKVPKGSRSPDRDHRRHAFSPKSLQTYKGSFRSGSGAAWSIPTFRKETTYPTQAHQPRRVASSLSQSIPSSIPQTPLLRPRGLSNASDVSPLHHAPMVGSYEESILRGRMSTTPSRPLNFVAQIGVLGRGQCRSSLRCPPHAVVPFPAVFYSYGNGSSRLTDNRPSPYVGLVDIENSLPPSKDPRDENGRRKRYASPAPVSDCEDGRCTPMHSGSEMNHIRRKRQRLKRRAQSPKAPPGGSYRIPQQGQLQIIIKNPNKTAVKLFLVPYDLSDMEPGQKTFVRQRSYSAGPVIDMPMSARINFGTDRPEASLSQSEDPSDRPVLRYLIHLHICCTAKGRYYLYKSIRVVFANRVPDGKERLRNEIQLPEPRYSAYKPVPSSQPHGQAQTHANPATFGLSASKMLADERAARRRSTPIDFKLPSGPMADPDQLSPSLSNMRWDFTAVSLPPPSYPSPFPLRRFQSGYSPRSGSDAHARNSGQTIPPPLPPLPPPPPAASLAHSAAPTMERGHVTSAWRERTADPFDFSNNPLEGRKTPLQRVGSPSPAQGLLARQLRELSVEMEGCNDGEVADHH